MPLARIALMRGKSGGYAREGEMAWGLYEQRQSRDRYRDEEYRPGRAERPVV